jgi:hypothetical protein
MSGPVTSPDVAPVSVADAPAPPEVEITPSRESRSVLIHTWASKP